MSNPFQRGCDLGRLILDKRLVQCGVRPVAERTVRNEHVTEARKLIESRDLPGREQLFYLESSVGDDHTDFYIFRHPHLKLIIEYIQEYEGEWDPDFTTWVYGTLFGYSERDIGQFIEAQDQK